jgi:hypothetical protein
MDVYDTNSHKFVLLSYKLIYTNSHKFVSQEKIESWRVVPTSCPAGYPIASSHPLVVPPSCPAPLIVIAVAVAPSIACRHRGVCRCRAAAAAAASTLLPPRCCVTLCTAAALLTPPRRRPVATTAAAAAAPLFVGWLFRCCPLSNFVIACRHATVDAFIAVVNIFV